MICTMQFTLLSSVALSVALAAPQQQSNFFDARNQNQNSQQYTPTPVPIINQKQEQNPDGSYFYSYEAGNGISVEERGAIKNLGQPDNEINSVQGFFSYPGPDGIQYLVSYTADERGFIASGPHIPTPPPMPAAIAKALETLPKDNVEYDDNGFPVPSKTGGFQNSQSTGFSQTGFGNSQTGFGNSQSRPTGPSSTGSSSGPSAGPSSFGDPQGFGGRA